MKTVTKRRPPGANTVSLFCARSYDSTIKIWHTQTMELLKTLTGQSGVIYCMSWSDDGLFLASTSIKGSVFVWDVENGDALTKLSHHDDACYCVDWNVLGQRLLVSTSGDCTACVFSSQDGNIHRRYRFPDAMYGCEWHPTRANW